MVLAACYGSPGGLKPETGDTGFAPDNTLRVEKEPTEIDLCAGAPEASIAATVQITQSCLGAGAATGSLIVGASLRAEAAGVCADAETGPTTALLTLTRDDGLEVTTEPVELGVQGSEFPYAAPWIGCESGTTCEHVWTAEASVIEGPSAHGTLWIAAELDRCGDRDPVVGEIVLE